MISLLLLKTRSRLGAWKSQLIRAGSLEIAILNRTLRLDMLRFGTRLPESHWPLSFSAPTSQRSNSHRLQDANANASILSIAVLHWGSPTASHTKASQPYFPHFFRIFVSAFSAFLLCQNLLKPLFFFSGVRGAFRIFPVSGSNR